MDIKKITARALKVHGPMMNVPTAVDILKNSLSHIEGAVAEAQFQDEDDLDMQKIVAVIASALGSIVVGSIVLAELLQVDLDMCVENFVETLEESNTKLSN